MATSGPLDSPLAIRRPRSSHGLAPKSGAPSGGAVWSRGSGSGSGTWGEIWSGSCGRWNCAERHASVSRRGTCGSVNASGKESVSWSGRSWSLGIGRGSGGERGNGAGAMIVVGAERAPETGRASGIGRARGIGRASGIVAGAMRGGGIASGVASAGPTEAASALPAGEIGRRSAAAAGARGRGPVRERGLRQCIKAGGKTTAVGRTDEGGAVGRAVVAVAMSLLVGMTAVGRQRQESLLAGSPRSSSPLPPSASGRR
mmetsp:Transcript_52062/g.116920  ORF Transcript_52062/g.116920 Transcript_52062/m.116920 type:complete len:258 (+) Transcript_52062:1542-2315(+)